MKYQNQKNIEQFLHNFSLSLLINSFILEFLIMFFIDSIIKYYEIILYKVFNPFKKNTNRIY
jgi:hypothetical protein